MTRPVLDYSQRRPSATRFAGYDPDEPIAGFYRMRLRSGGVFVGVRIWHGAPLDPVDGTELDRSHRWQAQANGRPINLERVWPACACEPIGSAEYAFLVAQQAWGEEHAPDSPQADPTRRIDPLSCPVPF